MWLHGHLWWVEKSVFPVFWSLSSNWSKGATFHRKENIWKNVFAEKEGKQILFEHVTLGAPPAYLEEMPSRSFDPWIWSSEKDLGYRF